jgi:hypothetical protein
MKIEDLEPTAFIQTQDQSGKWITVSTIVNKSTYILDSMKKAKGIYREARVRAVDSKDRILDIL